MRLCLLCETWKSGGIESFLYNVLTHTDLTGLEVDLVAAQLCQSVFTQPLEALGVRFVELSGSLRRVEENHRLFRRVLEARRYDAVHVNAFQGVSLAYLRLAWEAGVPVRIAHSHNTALRKSPTRGAKLVLHRLARSRYTRYATQLWACSEAAARFLFPQGELDRRGFQFIPNGIDTDRFRFDPQARQEVRRELKAGESTLVIGNVGRLCGQKNQSFLLEVFAAVEREQPDSLLLLVGDGEDRQALAEKAERLGLADRVIFYGVSQEIERLFWAMDVFAFPSLFEGLGIVAVEAQAAGLPVLCSERVPPEVRLTGRVECVPLAGGAASWADRVRRAPPGDRAGAADRVRQAGFDIRDGAKIIKETWTNGK